MSFQGVPESDPGPARATTTQHSDGRDAYVAGPLTIVHDYLTQRGGAERVALLMAQGFPDATLVTTFYQPEATFPEFGARAVQTSRWNRIAALRRDPRRAFPLLPMLVRWLPTAPGPVLCSSSGWAHAMRSRGPKVVYCHNPARWLYQPDDYFAAAPRAARSCLRVALTPYRAWDRRHAATATYYFANSAATAARIKAAYGIDAVVLHPPAGLRSEGSMSPVPDLEPGFHLTVGRARGYKRTDLVVEAVRRTATERLVVVGARTPDVPTAGGRIRAVGRVPDDQLRWLYANAASVVAVGHEDFGLTPVEGYQFGTPCVALRAGGYLETVQEHVTGQFINCQDADELAETLTAFDPAAFDPAKIKERGAQFTPERFVDVLQEALREAQAQW